jgi:hypothetical protein
LADSLRAQVRQELVARYGPDAFKRRLQFLFPRLPRKPIGRGTEWKRQHVLPGNFRFDATGEYFVSKAETDLLELRVNGSAQSDTTQDIDYSSRVTTPHLQGAYNGAMQIDGNQVLYKNLRLSMEAKGHLQIGKQRRQPLQIEKTMRINRVEQPGKPAS